MLTLDVYLVFVQHHLLLAQLLPNVRHSLERRSARVFQPAHAVVFVLLPFQNASYDVPLSLRVLALLVLQLMHQSQLSLIQFTNLFRFVTFGQSVGARLD